MMKPPIFCLIGPTASGKTQAAVELVQKYPLEIISVDASMIYRRMDIGTAKPEAEILKIAPHRLINICDPCESYSAGQFCEDAVREIEDIFSRGKLPLLVGGTMLYFHALRQGLSELPQKNMQIRESINEEARQTSWRDLHARLSKIDPVAANRIHYNDTQRISRALEIYQITHQSWTSLLENRKPYLDYPIINLALWVEERHVLHQRISERFESMLAKGWIEEVEQLLQRGDLSDTTPSLRAVGYRQICRYLKGQLSFDAMKDQCIFATRQLAKRQITWMRGLNDTHSINTESPEALKKAFKKIFTCYT